MTNQSHMAVLGQLLEDDRFRLRGKTFMLTYPDHIDREDLSQQLQEIEGEGLLYLAIGQEIGKTGHEHTHAFVHRSKGRDVKNARAWDAIHQRDAEDPNPTLEGTFEGYYSHPNVRVPNTEIHKQRQLNYVFKEDADALEWGDRPKFGDDEWSSVIATIQAKTGWNDLIQDPSLAPIVSQKLNWAREVWNARPRASLLEQLEWWPGPLTAEQEQWHSALMAQTRRQVLWVVDPQGGLGKSDFGIWLREQWEGGDAFLMDGGSVADQIHAYQGQPLVVVDIPRDTENDRYPYRLIENFKRGWASSTKYQSCVKTFKPAKVIVFSNANPDPSKLSKDRWVVFNYAMSDVGPHYYPAFPGVP